MFISAGPQMYINGQCCRAVNTRPLWVRVGVGCASLSQAASDNGRSAVHVKLLALESKSAGPYDFTAKWNGTTLLPLDRCGCAGLHAYTFTLLPQPGTDLTLEFDARQDPVALELGQYLGDGDRHTGDYTDPNRYLARLLSSRAQDHCRRVCSVVTGTAEANSTVTGFYALAERSESHQLAQLPRSTETCGRQYERSLLVSEPDAEHPVIPADPVIPGPTL